MSNILRTKQGNLSKVKYFLPASRNSSDSTHPLEPIKNSNLKMSKPTSSKKKSTVANIQHNKSDLSF